MAVLKSANTTLRQCTLLTLENSGAAANRIVQSPTRGQPASYLTLILNSWRYAMAEHSIIVVIVRNNEWETEKAQLEKKPF